MDDHAANESNKDNAAEKIQDFSMIPHVDRMSEQDLHALVSHDDQEAVKQLQRYLIDYLKKSGRVSEEICITLADTMNLKDEMTPPIDTATGFLLDWWLLFWDLTCTKSVSQMKAYLSDLKQGSRTSEIENHASQKRLLDTSPQDKSPMLGTKKTKSEVNIEAILEAQKAHVAAAQAMTLKQQEILNATLAHSRHASFSQAAPQLAHQSNASMTSMLTPDFDSLNLEERKIWLQQLQQQNAAAAMYSMSAARLPPAPPANYYPMVGGTPIGSSASLMTRTAPPTYQWVMPPPQPYATAGPLFGPAPIPPSAMMAQQPTPPFFYNPSHRYQNMHHQTVPTTPQYIKPAPVPPSGHEHAMLVAQQQQVAASTANMTHHLSTASLIMDPDALLAKTHPGGSEAAASAEQGTSTSSPTKYANLMNESLMNESLFLDLDDIFFNRSP